MANTLDPAPMAMAMPATKIRRETLITVSPARLIEAGIACVPVISIDDPDYNPDVQLTSPQIAANELVARHQHPVFGTVRQPGQFVRFDGKPAVFSRSAPVLGEHNEEIARSLGYDDARITALREKGVLAGGA